MPSPPSPQAGKRPVWLLALLTLLISLLLVLAAGELLVRWLDPQATMLPRSRFSAAYGLEFHPNRVMVNELSGQWRFSYTTNAQGHRGPVLPLSNRYLRPNVVVLGDSYTFGYGIADGEEYPAQMRRLLGDSHDVVNLGVGGWGLTQEIRRYYELGRLYEPQVVVLQFTGNDPSDNQLYNVTRVEGGRLLFQDRDEDTAISVVKRLLSESPLQRSHLYALARGHLYYLFRGREIAATPAAHPASAAAGAAPASQAEQQLYNELLETFARDLSARGVRLLLIAVDGHLALFPQIEARMRDLDARGLARFIDVDALFQRVPHDVSPEGHWGPASHRSVAAAVVEAIRTPAAGASAPAAAASASR
jgi:hypothetical protein